MRYGCISLTKNRLIKMPNQKLRKLQTGDRFKFASFAVQIPGGSLGALQLLQLASALPSPQAARRGCSLLLVPSRKHLGGLDSVAALWISPLLCHLSLDDQIKQITRLRTFQCWTTHTGSSQQTLCIGLCWHDHRHPPRPHRDSSPWWAQKRPKGTHERLFLGQNGSNMQWSDCFCFCFIIILIQTKRSTITEQSLLFHYSGSLHMLLPLMGMPFPHFST